VWITTYAVAQSKHDRSFFKKQKFKYMVLDEAQNIKNTSSQRYKSLFSLRSENRLLLTGTPVEVRAPTIKCLFTFGLIFCL
jgi:SNF2 family DNA or RNA helicase